MVLVVRDALVWNHCTIHPSQLPATPTKRRTTRKSEEEAIQAVEGYAVVEGLEKESRNKRNWCHTLARATGKGVGVNVEKGEVLGVEAYTVHHLARRWRIG